VAKKPRASARESEDQLTYLLRDKKGELVFFAASILGNEANAEDAVITAYERAFQSLNTFTPGPATLETWFREIIQNACIDELRAGHLSLGAAVEDEEDPDYESVAPIAAIHPLSKLGSGDPSYSGQGLLDAAEEEKKRRLDNRLAERLEEFDHPIPDDWEEGLREVIEKENSFCKATMLDLLDDERMRPLVADAAAVLWRAHVSTPERFVKHSGQVDPRGSRRRMPPPVVLEGLEFRGIDLYPATQFTAILHGALWEVAVGLSSHYTEMAKRASKTKPPKIGLRRALLALRHNFLQLFGHPVDAAVALLLRAGFGGKWTARMVQARASKWKGIIF